ncbi:MAG TPA: NADPH-dependent F420 reductase [Candidatus Binatia bacterium]|nr:NADPH-dependent F420 reductase [Candidatus Binatia bacterium]
MRPLAIVGGTGPEGIGLALRFAAAGQEVLVGSRDAARAEAAAARVAQTVPGARVASGTNHEVVSRTDRIVLALPFAGLVPFLDSAPDGLAGKLLIDVVVPLAVRAGFFEIAPIPGAPSAGELIQRRLPGARVVSAFKNLSAAKLGDLGASLAGDVVLCGEDPGARAEVAALVGLLPGLRAVDAGGIANARWLEAITALLLNLNRRHGTITSIAILGV